MINLAAAKKAVARAIEDHLGEDSASLLSGPVEVYSKQLRDVENEAFLAHGTNWETAIVEAHRKLAESLRLPEVLPPMIEEEEEEERDTEVLPAAASTGPVGGGNAPLRVGRSIIE
jgi:hypothetical protein